MLSHGLAGTNNKMQLLIKVTLQPHACTVDEEGKYEGIFLAKAFHSPFFS